MTWLISPLVSGGTVLSACAGQFRVPTTTDVVLATSGVQLSLFETSGTGKLLCVLKQPVFCSIKQLQVLHRSEQGQTDDVLALLETGNLAVLQFNHQLNRFSVVQEVSLAHGPAEADQLGHRLAVTNDGKSLAVAAARGRIACLSCLPSSQHTAATSGQSGSSTAELSDAIQPTRHSAAAAGQCTWAMQGARMLSEPVVYAAAAPAVAGAVNFSRELQDRMELGSIVDLAFFSCSSRAVTGATIGLQQAPGPTYLAVLSHRRAEDASEVVVYSWSAAAGQLTKLGVVTILHRGFEAVMDPLLHLAAVPSSPTAMVLTSGHAILVLDFAAVLQPQTSLASTAVSATVEVVWDHVIFEGQSKGQQKHWQDPQSLSELRCMMGRCVTAAESSRRKAQLLQDLGADSRQETPSPEAIAEQPSLEPAQAQEADDGAGLPLQAEDPFVSDDFDQEINDMDENRFQVTQYAGDSESMSEGGDNSSREGHDGLQSALAAIAARNRMNGPPIITAWTWMSSLASDQQHLPDRAPGQGRSSPARAATSTALDALVLATVSGSVIKVSLLVETAGRTVATSGNLAASGDVPASSNLPAGGDNPASSSNLEQQPSRVYVSAVHQLLQMQQPAELLVPLADQQLIAVSNSKSTVHLLAPSVTPVAAATMAPSLQQLTAASLHQCQQQQEQHQLVLALKKAATAVGSTPPHSQSTGPAAGSSLLGSAVGRLDDLNLEPPDDLEPLQLGEACPQAGTAIGMELDSPTSPARVTTGFAEVHEVAASALELEGIAAQAAVVTAAAVPPHQGKHLQQQQTESKLSPHQQRAQMQYHVAGELQLLGPVAACTVIQQGQQQRGSTTATAGATGHSPESSKSEGAVLIAASRRASGGLRVLVPGTHASLLQSGPLGMLDGATGLWPVPLSPHSTTHSVLVISFAAASRVLAVGETFKDVSEVVGLLCSEATVLAASAGDGLMLQVTPSGARLCCLDNLLYESDSSSAEQLGGEGSRGSGSWKRQDSSNSRTDAVSGRRSSEMKGAGEATSDPSHSTAAAAVGVGGGTAHEQQQQEQTTWPHADTAAPPPPPPAAAAAEAIDQWSVQAYLQQQRQRHCSLSAVGDNSIVQGFTVKQPQQEQQLPASVVLAAAAPGAAILFLSSGQLVLLGISLQQQLKQHSPQPSQMGPITGDSGRVAAAAAGKAPLCRKRGRMGWSLAVVAKLNIRQQLSCLQVHAIRPNSSSSSNSSSTAGSYYIFAGCYDGSLQMFAVHPSTTSRSSIQLVGSFDIEQLHPLRLLLQITAGPSSRTAAACAASPAVPDSCLVIPHTADSAVHVTQGPGTATSKSGTCSAAAGGSAAARSRQVHGNTNLPLLLMVSYRNGDIVLYQLTQTLQQQQPASAQCSTTITAPATAASSDHVQLRVLSQLRVPGAPAKLQLLGPHGWSNRLNPVSSDPQVLAASDGLWVLQINRFTGQVKIRPLVAPKAVLTAGFILPATAETCTAEAAPQHLQQDGSISQSTGTAVDTEQGHQHLACVLPDGQLQLLSVPLLQQLQQQHMQTWLEGIQVSQLVQHPGSQMLLAICKGPSPSSSPPGDVVGPEAPHVSWLQCVDPTSSARSAAYQPSGGQSITCMGLWAAADAFAAGPWPRSDSSSSPEQQQYSVVVGSHRRIGIAAAVGALLGRRGGDGAGRGRRVTRGLRNGGTAVDPPLTQGPAQVAAAGTLGDTRQAYTGTGSVPEQRFHFGDLLRCCSNTGSPSRLPAYRSYFQGLGGTSGYTSQRVGPLVILGTEIKEAGDQVDGSKGQVVVLRLLQHAVPGNATGPDLAVASNAAAQSSQAAAAALRGQATANWHPLYGTLSAAAAPAADTAAIAAAAPAAASPCYSIQRVARLRMPDPVTAVCGYSSDLLLAAVGNALAVYQIHHDKLQQAAHCFTRAPTVSLSVADTSTGLVMAADMFQGVTAYQVQVHAATGQVSLQAIAAHIDVRRVQQVACLPLVPVGTRRNQVTNGHSSSRSNAVDAQVSMLGRTHSLCLDSKGCVMEVAWAKQRAVPAKTLATAACMPLGGPAATLQVPDSSSSSREEWRVRCSYDLTGSEDILAHWQDPTAAAAAAGGTSPGQPLAAAAGDAASYAVAATASGTVSHMQKLSTTEGRVLQLLEQAILQHPLTKPLCIGSDHLLQQQQGANPAGSGVPPCKPPEKLNAVDARVLGVLLLLPYELQQQILRQAGVGRVLSSRVLKSVQQPQMQQAVLDAILCRLQVLPAWE